MCGEKYAHHQFNIYPSLFRASRPRAPVAQGIASISLAGFRSYANILRSLTGGQHVLDLYLPHFMKIGAYARLLGNKSTRTLSWLRREGYFQMIHSACPPSTDDLVGDPHIWQIRAVYTVGIRPVISTYRASAEL